MRIPVAIPDAGGVSGFAHLWAFRACGAPIPVRRHDRWGPIPLYEPSERTKEPEMNLHFKPRFRGHDRTAVLAAVLLALVAAGVARASTYFVPQDFPTIQAAINFASDGDTVVVQSGTYFENVNTLGKDIRLNGVVVNSPTIIGSPGSPVLTVGANSNPPLISNLTLRDGDGLLGGGIAVGANTTTVIRNVRIWQNTATSGGAVFLHSGSHVTMEDCDLWANHASVQGGGIFMLAGSSLTLVDTLIESNTADQSGGALRAYDAEVDISGTTHFLSNSSVRDGGAIEALNGTIVTMANARFTGNHAGWSGGAIFLDGASMDSRSALFDSNSAVAPGGAVALIGASEGFSWYDSFTDNTALNGGAVRVLESRFYANVALMRGNTAADFGGAIAVTGNENQATAWLFNSVIDDNTARWGGASFVNIGPQSAGVTSVMFANCEITNNTASTPTGQGGVGVGQNGLPSPLSVVRVVNSLVTRNGGGTRNGIDVANNGRIALQNSIVWNNSGPGLSGDIFGQSVSRSILPEAASFPGAGNMNTDPRLRNPGAGDFALLMTSPAIDAGDSTLVPSDSIDDDGDGNFGERLPLDLRGYARFVNDPLTPDTGVDAGLGVVDIGPHEFRRTCAADFAEPIGTLNFFDVSAFIAAFNAGQPAADLAAPFGVFNFFDVSAFMSFYNGGCP